MDRTEVKVGQEYTYNELMIVRIKDIGYREVYNGDVLGEYKEYVYFKIVKFSGHEDVEGMTDHIIMENFLDGFIPVSGSYRNQKRKLEI